MAITTEGVSFQTITGSAMVMSNTVVSVEGTDNEFTVKVPVNGLGLQNHDGTNTASFGTVTLGGGIGDITALTVDSVQIFDVGSPVVGGTPADLTQQAADLAVAINGYLSSPNYTATSVGTLVTISADRTLAATPNGYVVATTTDAALTKTDVNFSAGALGLTTFLASMSSVFVLPLSIGGTANLNANYVRSVVPNEGTGSYVNYSDEFGMYVRVYESTSDVAAVLALIAAL